MVNIIVRDYQHYNRAMETYIRNKRHYDYEMKKRGFVSQEEGDRLAEKHKEQKKWTPSEGCIEVIRAIKNASDKKGNIVLGRHPKIVKAMEERGMSFDMNKLPEHYREIR